MSIPDGIRPESNGTPTDSAFSQPASQNSHSQPPTSSRTDAQTRGRADETATTARLREIHPLDAITAVILELRPEWRPEHIRAVVARDRRPWADVVTAAIECALDPGIRSPAAIENHGTRNRDQAVPVLPTVAEALTLELCPQHKDQGFRADACPLCRRDAQGAAS